MKFCPKCDIRLKKSSDNPVLSCPKCGYPAPPDEKGKELKDGVLIISALIISLLVLVIFFLLGGFK